MAASKIPLVSGGLPIVGHLFNLRQNPFLVIQRGLSEHGKIFRFKFFHKNMHVLLGPEYNSLFFRASNTQLDIRDFHRIIAPIIGKGVAYDAELEVMEKHMHVLRAAMHESVINSHLENVVREVNACAVRWGGEGEIDLLDAMQDLFLTVMGSFVFGSDAAAGVSPILVQLCTDMKRGLDVIPFLWPNAPTPANWRRHRARREIGLQLSKIIDRRASVKTETPDLLSSLLRINSTSSNPLSAHELTGLLLFAFFAGQINAPGLATWTGLLLTDHLDRLALIREEAADLLTEHRPILEILRSQHRMECFIKETERLYTSHTLLPRKVLRDFCVGDMIISKGDYVVVSPAVSHLLPDIFPDPHVFDPDRFSAGREEDKAHPFSLIGFGGGRHHCLGYTLTHQIIKIIWGVLAQKFEFTADLSTIKLNKKKPVREPTQPCLVRYRLR